MKKGQIKIALLFKQKTIGGITLHIHFSITWALCRTHSFTGIADREHIVHTLTALQLSSVKSWFYLSQISFTAPWTFLLTADISQDPQTPVPSEGLDQHVFSVVLKPVFLQGTFCIVGIVERELSWCLCNQRQKTENTGFYCTSYFYKQKTALHVVWNLQFQFFLVFFTFVVVCHCPHLLLKLCISVPLFCMSYKLRTPLQHEEGNRKGVLGTERRTQLPPSTQGKSLLPVPASLTQSCFSIWKEVSTLMGTAPWWYSPLYTISCMQGCWVFEANLFKDCCMHMQKMGSDFSTHPCISGDCARSAFFSYSIDENPNLIMLRWVESLPSV